MILYAAGADGPGLRRFRFWSAPIPGGPRLLCLPPGPVPAPRIFSSSRPPGPVPAPKRKKGRPAGAASDLPIMLSGSQQRGPRLPCVYRPGPVLFWPGRRSACPGAVDHAAVAGGADDGGPGPASPGLAMPSVACARSSRGRWTVSLGRPPGSPGAPAPRGLGRPSGLPPAAARPALPRPAPGRGAPEGRRWAAPVRPPRFSPRFPAGISPVTRAAGDSPAHNARPRRFPA